MNEKEQKPESEIKDEAPKIKLEPNLTGSTKATSPFLGLHPQQNYFEFGTIKFDSRFDSGNLGKVVNVDTDKVSHSS